MIGSAVAIIVYTGNFPDVLPSQQAMHGVAQWKPVNAAAQTFLKGNVSRLNSKLDNEPPSPVYQVCSTKNFKKNLN